MPGAEGRKDPFSSLYAYLPGAISYDSACSFHEYSLNREQDYFKQTQFWQDIFHFNIYPHSGQVVSTPLMSLRFVSNLMPLFRTSSTLVLT